MWCSILGGGDFSVLQQTGFPEEIGLVLSGSETGLVWSTGKETKNERENVIISLNLDSFRRWDCSSEVNWKRRNKWKREWIVRFKSWFFPALRLLVKCGQLEKWKEYVIIRYKSWNEDFRNGNNFHWQLPLALEVTVNNTIKRGVNKCWITWLMAKILKHNFKALPHKVKNAVCDILAIFVFLFFCLYENIEVYVLSDGKNDFWKIIFKMFVWLFVSSLFLQENSVNTNVLVSQEALTYYVHYMFYNISKQFTLLK